MYTTLKFLIKILATIGTIYSWLRWYKNIPKVLGLFIREKFKATNNKHKFGICIAARNEEKVIKNLLDSIYNQDYPMDKVTIFVVADNCTDSTAQIVRDYITQHNVENLKLYEHNNPDERTKGYALRYLFDKIKQDYGIKAYEGYMIFDADNVLQKDYISRMNEAYDAGNKIITSCRFSKNMNQNWISFSYAMHWLRTCLFENNANYLFKLSCRIQGTGFLFDNTIVENGWNYTTLTEDRALCSDAVVKGIRVSYCADAIFYDEQPYKFKIAWRQRLRWAKGHLQSTVENSPKLFKNMFKFNKDFFMTYDCFWLNFPAQIERVFRKILRYLLRFCIIIFLGQTFTSVFGSPFWGYVLSILIDRLISWGKKCFDPLLVLLCYRKRLGKMPFWRTFFSILMFPLFDYIGKYTYLVALFTKVEWKPIPHDTVMDIKELNSKNEKAA